MLVYNYSQLRRYAGPIVDNTAFFQWIILGVGSFLFVLIIIGIILFIIFMARQIMLNQLQKNFIDSVTHELKTPLTSLQLYIQTLKRHDLPREKKDTFLDIMLEDVERLDTLVNHVLEAAKLENTKRHYQFNEVELLPLLEKCADIVCRRYNLAAEAISIRIPATRIQSDANALQLVFLNLLDNAVKYSHEQVHVVVAATIHQTGRIQVSIQDSGSGIPPSEIKKIFRRFYRSADESSKNQKGSGLGLFIVKETLKHLRGSVEVNSDGSRQGACFTVTLPCREQYA